MLNASEARSPLGPSRLVGGSEIPSVTGLCNVPLITLSAVLAGSGAPAMPASVTVSSMHIDEQTDDLIVATAAGEIFIYRLGLYHHTTSSESAPQTPFMGDVMHLNTGGSLAQIVKCSPLPLRSMQRKPSGPVASASAWLYPVAVCHSEESVSFYLVEANKAPQTNITPVAASYTCAPRNLRFRDRFYPIRTVYWTASRLDDASHHSVPSSRTAFTAGLLLVVTQISVELGRIALKDEAVTFTLLQRVTTTCDYWAYNALARCIVIINKKKPSICKPFFVDYPGRVGATPTGGAASSAATSATNDEAQLATLAQLTLEDIPTITSAFVNPASTSLMDAPIRLQMQVLPFLLYGHLFILHVTSQRNLLLYRFRNSDMSSTQTSSQAVSVGGGSIGSSFTKLVTTDAHLSQPTARGGQFEVVAQLAFHSSVDSSLLSSELLKIQVVDNLIVVHLVHARVSVFYDIGVTPVEASLLPPQSPTAHGSSFFAFSSASGESFVPASSFATQSQFAWHADPYASGYSTPREASPQLVHSANQSPRSEKWFTKLSSWGASASSAAPSPSVSRGGSQQQSTHSKCPVILSSSGFRISCGGGERDISSGPECFYALELYSGSLPLILDRNRAKVMLVSMRPTTLVRHLSDVPRKVEFFLNRRYGDPLSAVRLLSDLLVQQEPLTAVAQSFDVITNFHSRSLSRRRQRSATVTSATASSPNAKLPSVCAYPVLIPSTRPADVDLLSRMHVVTNEQQPLLTAKDFWPVLASSSAEVLLQNQWDEQTHPCRPHVDQATLYRYVFAPLVQRATAATLRQSSNHSAPQQQHQSSTEVPSDDGSNRNRYHESVVSFSHYLLNSILEYGRSLVQNGESLSDATQRCILNLFLQQPSTSKDAALDSQETSTRRTGDSDQQSSATREEPPDYFRLHQLLMFRAIDDRVSTALQLVSLEAKYPPAFQMGLDMLARLNAVSEIVNVYIAKQQPLIAAKHIVANGRQALGETSGATNSPRRSKNVVDDVLFCSAFLHDEERKEIGLSPFDPSASLRTPELDRGREMTRAGSQFYTIFAILAAHFPEVVVPDSATANPVYATHKARFTALSEGKCC